MPSVAIRLRVSRAGLVVAIGNSISGLDVVGATLIKSNVATLPDVIIELEPLAVIAMLVSCFHLKCPDSDTIVATVNFTERRRLVERLRLRLPFPAPAVKFDPSSSGIEPSRLVNAIPIGGTPRFAST